MNFWGTPDICHHFAPVSSQISPTLSQTYLAASKGVQSWNWYLYFGDAWLLEAKLHPLAYWAKAALLLWLTETEKAFWSKEPAVASLGIGPPESGPLGNRPFMNPWKLRTLVLEKKCIQMCELGGF